MNMETLWPAEGVAGDALRECFVRAGDRVALVCACVTELYACLADGARGACSRGGHDHDDHPVDEAGAWCRRFVVRQDLGCSPNLCAPQVRHREGDANFTVGTALVCCLALVSIVHLAYTYHINTAAGRQAFGIKPKRIRR